MTHEENLKIIREACIKANPSILDLEFGCEVTTQKGFRAFYVGKNDVEDEEYFIDVDQVGVQDSQFLIDGKGYHSKILGRPIRLADVLLAIEANKEKWQKDNWFTDFFVGTNGFIQGYSHKSGIAILSSRKESPYIPDLKWNLKQDDLTLQSPETIEFLASLIVKK